MSFGAGLAHTEHLLPCKELHGRHGRGVRIVVICKEGSSEGGGGGGGAPIPSRPTVLFVPGGGFIADFEAVDLFFLYHWVRATHCTVVYMSYDFAPQAPYPVAMVQVSAVYQQLREGSCATALGFRAAPLVLAGLSAGGNLGSGRARPHAATSPLTRPPTSPA